MPARNAASEAPAARSRPLRPGELAWIATVPCGVAIVLAIVVLGPLIGHAFLAPGAEALWPPRAAYVFGTPEPEKHGRYVVALMGPLLLGGSVLAGSRRPPLLRASTIRRLVALGQALTFAFLIAATLGQNDVLFKQVPAPWPIFSVAKLTTAFALALMLAAVGRVARVSRALRETRLRHGACIAVAAVFGAIWLSMAVNTDHTIGKALVSGLTEWTMDDPFAVLDGRTPLVDFHPMYAQLLPYPVAAAMWAAGPTILTYTLVMTGMSLLALLAVYACFRRIVRSSLLALCLYVPFVSTGFLPVVLEADLHLSNLALFSMWPMRYGGAYLTAWLTARHLDGVAPRRAWVLLGIVGLVAIDNLEFGLATLAGTLLALVLAVPHWSRRAAMRLAGELAIGFLGAFALVALLTLVRSGRLPHYGLLLEFPHIFGVLGLTALPMPLVGFQLAVYATFVAAIGVAVVRTTRNEDDRLLTSMLAWSGAFGLLAGSYYVGRSDILKLVSLFSAWCFALALLTVVVMREIAAGEQRFPRAAQLLVLFGFALAVCSLRDVPTPWSQIVRLGDITPTAIYKQPDAVAFVAAHTDPGERVGILIRLGHRVAYDVGVVNVAPYAFMEAMVTRQQMQTLLDTLRRERAHKLFVPNAQLYPPQSALLNRAGFSQRLVSSDYSLWKDTTPR